ncbi:non-ribosomal peptide synthetase [Xenorhabdus hominickii]|uniref:Pyoverdine sidechain peptide synthetase n=1 Tax=Xenorhabdus hominickii TaxID=351679 RepID=A0A2G0Q2U9_XENHO|nr:non-ribosomal peptide synthetase [Xenorhabdus hominickii]PHM53531.1 pyoverdine sidechain peptide synthetase [Xenorhabdus hominickii]
MSPDLHHLHPAQENVFYEQILYENSSINTLGWYTLIEENIDITLLQKAWNLLHQHIDTLRLRILINSDNEAVQYIQEQSIPTLINEYDVSRLSDPENSALLWMKQQTNTPIDYLNEIPYQITLIRLTNEKNYFFTTFHHIFIDGVGLYRFHEYVYKLYTCLKNGTFTTWLSEIPQYLTAVKKAREYLNNFNYEYDKNYWMDFLKENEIHQLIPYYQKTGTDHKTLTFPLSVKNDLRSFCHENNTSIPVFFYSLISIIMAELTGQQELVFNTTTHGRTTKSEKYVVGMQANMYPIHCHISRESLIVEQIKQVESALKSNHRHGKFPSSHFARLAKQYGFSLPNILILYDRFSASATEINQTQHFHIDTEFNINPIVFRLKDHGYDQELKITIQYLQAYFSDSDINNILERLNNLLTTIIDNPAVLVSELPILLEQERHTLLHSWNQTDALYPQDKTLQQQFEAQAAANPNNVALVFEGETLTYRQLNERANQLALVIRERYQQQHSVPMPMDTLIALYLDRSPEMVIGILAVLKAGGAYVPVSPDYPPERVQFILDDTQSPCVVTQQKFLPTLQAYTQAHVTLPALIAADDWSVTENYSTENLVLAGQTTDLAYVIYTSGTTGKPKGVLQTHHNVNRLFTNSQKDYQFDQHDVWVLFHAYTFDFSVWELWGALLYGGRLIIPTVEYTKDFSQFSCFCAEQNVTVLNQTPGAFYAFIDEALNNSAEFPHLRYVIFGGDKLNPVQLKPWWDRYGDQKPALINMYGITETTVHVTYKKLTQGDTTAVSRIGRPLSDMYAYVLNPAGQLAPIGAPGELYIGGAGLARGYLNRPELTAERFIENPFATDKNKEQGYTRLYKTGDLARWLPDGELEYLGRNDFQVKIRGYRIELGEIESALAAHPQVKQAVVIDREYQGNTALVAYLVIESELSDEGLISHLSSLLPDYMLPASFTRIEAIPLTLNGKVDRQALPEPNWGNKDDYVAPRNTLETQLCTIWQAVLELERVGIEDNFFRIGGNSLTAIKLIAAIRRTLSTDISLAQLFELKTIAGLMTQMEAQICTVIPHLTQERYPLSFAQERMLFIEQFEQGSDVYHIPYLVQLDNAATLPLLETAINRLAERHAVLRTVYRSDDQGQMYQQVLDTNLVIQSQSCHDRDTLLANARTEIATPFDLTTEPSLRLRHYQMADSHYLLLQWHHIAMDGWSIDIFMAELAEICHALQAGRDSQLPELEINYGDYSVWQRDYLQGDVREQQLAYWQQVLAGYESLALPTDHPRPAQVNYQGRDVNFELDALLSEQLRTLAKTQETTLYTVMLSAFYVTLAKLTGQDDIVIGTPTDNRHHAQTQSLLGMFVNSLALRAQLQHTDSVTALIKQTHQLVTGAKAHQDMPFEQLLDTLEIERDSARHPIFQVMFGVQHFGENSSNNRLPFSPVTLDETLYSPAKFDLSLFLSDGKTAITGCLNYALSLFNETSITRIADIYQRVLSTFVADQQQPLSGIDILSAQERHTLLHNWNQTDVSYSQDKTLQQLFEAQAARTPDHVALVFEGESLTYHQLNQRANQLAHVIRERYQQQHHQTMQADTPIALYFDRSPEMIISMLAVMKAGGAYVPVSPEYPTERVQFILTDTATPCVLTQQRYLTILQQLAESSILIAADNQADTVSQPVENPESISKPTDLAYIIYTSGTTGQPKGVMVEHKNVAHLVAAQTTFFDAEKTNKSLMFAAYVFDASVFELFPALLNGLTLYLCNEAERNAPAIAQLIQREGIQMATLPPAILTLLTDVELPSLQLLVTAGESPSLDFMEHFSQHSNVMNAYGPTEITVCATQKRYQHGDIATNIGKAINNASLYVLDSYGNPSPIGTPGELYIGGAGVARGYLNRPELTAERFVANLFATANDTVKGYTRLYKTGDLVRWLPNGELEYLGRNDFQVKIRGFRIELGEIESALTAHSQVKQAVVIDREHQGHKVLAAYLVVEDAVSDDMLLAYLSEHLPDYMLPTSFTFIEAIPLTLNGKVDRRALPEPVFGDRENYVAPRNSLETQLCAIWQAVLGLERISIHDNFFRIGGDSIVSIQLVSKLRQAGFSLQVKTIFEAPTVAQLAPLLMQTASTAEVVAEQGLLNGKFALLPVQQTFFDWQLAHPHHWNQAFMVQISGNIPSVQIERALIALTERHDILRARFVETEQGYHQCYSADISSSQPQLKHGDIRQCNQEELRQQLTQWQIGFDYHNGPLWQAAHLTGYADGSARLFFAFHHLIIDAVSWRIIAEDMRLLLQGMTLPAKTSSYRQWVTTVHQYAQQHQHEVPYWQQVLAGNNSKPALDNLTHHQLGISVEMTDILLHEANIGYRTEINDLLLSALTVALQETFDQSVNHIILEGHGRESIDNTIDISETVGWFTTLYPVRLEKQTDMADTLIHTKEMLRAVPNKGIGYGALQQAGYLTDHLPVISFNYLGQLGSASRQDWSITDDDCGNTIASENDSHLLLGINGAVQAGKLLFYVDSRLPQSKTVIFIRAFEQALNHIITTAQKQSQTGEIMTPSDYGIKGVSLEQFNQLTHYFEHTNNVSSHHDSENETTLDL